MLKKYIILTFCGGSLYQILELLWRGYSHWTMFILGGLCFVLLGLINEVLPWNMPLLLQGIVGSAIIVTPLEFITGYIVNIQLGWNIWDYSSMPFNFMGQICLSFSFLWIFISILAIILDDQLRYWQFKEEKPHYK